MSLETHGQTPALVHPPDGAFLSSCHAKYLQELRDIGNPCFACGTRQGADARACRRCGEPLPSQAPLPEDASLRITEKGIACRQTLFRRRGIVLGLMVGVSAAFALLSSALAPLIQTWTEFYMTVGTLTVSLVATLVVAYRTSHQSWGITKTQVVLFRRAGKVRAAYRRWLRERGALSSGPAPLPTGESLHLTSPSNAFPVAEEGDLSWARDIEGMNEFTLEGGFRMRGTVPGYPGKFWKVLDGKGKEGATLVLDNAANKTWVLQRTDLELCAVHREYWALFRGGRRVGSFIGETRSDDSVGTAQVSRVFLDATGREFVRVTGSHHTYPTTPAMLLDALRSGAVYSPGRPGNPVYRASPDAGENTVSFSDATGRKVATAQRQEDRWHVEVVPGARADLAALGFLALLSWNPDGISFGLAHLLERRPDLASKVAST